VFLLGCVAVLIEAWDAYPTRIGLSLLAVGLSLAAAIPLGWAWKQFANAGHAIIFINEEKSFFNNAQIHLYNSGNARLFGLDSFIFTNDSDEFSQINGYFRLPTEIDRDSIRMAVSLHPFNDTLGVHVSAPLRRDHYTVIGISRTCYGFWPLYAEGRKVPLGSMRNDSLFACIYILPKSPRLVWARQYARDSVDALRPPRVVDTTSVPQ
jgi:hypothetical protein